jgi:hypothetical protein
MPSDIRVANYLPLPTGIPVESWVIGEEYLPTLSWESEWMWSKRDSRLKITNSKAVSISYNLAIRLM